ncbi:MAG: DUF1566 domain-containing protein [Anaerolineae bacterium]|jgi:hypothetical protein
MWKKLLIAVALLGLVTCGYLGYGASASARVAGETQEASTSYPVVDTGQSLCYDDRDEIACPAEGQAFYGQDAQLDGNQPSYTLSADGLTVYDNVTGLTWTQSPDLDGDGQIDADDKLTFSEAQAYPDTLNAQNYGGYSDWRLPTIKELYSLIDFRGLDPSGPNPTNLVPFIDTDYFDFAYGDESAGERLIDAQFWSSNAYLGTVFGNQQAAFGLNLADGRIKGYPTSGPRPKVNYLYFVRGNTSYGANDFVDNGDGTVTDHATGLIWSQDDSGDGLNTGPRSGMTWEDALAWVEQKNAENYLGYSDWRLPNAKEMQSILDYDRAPDATASAAIDPVFNITQITNEAGQADYPWFWTSTTHARSNGSGAAGAYICFGRATGYMNGAWIDVHGAGAQRSDQKGGDLGGFVYEPDGYYFSQAPQGDATRIYNYVRLVRDAGVSEPNIAPTAEAGGPYSGQPGSAIILSAAASADPDGTIVLYEWDLDGDGRYDDATGVTATFSAAASGTFAVGLRVTDDGGAQDVDAAIVQVTDGSVRSHQIYLPLVLKEGGGGGANTVSPETSPSSQGRPSPGQADQHPKHQVGGDGSPGWRRGLHGFCGQSPHRQVGDSLRPAQG